MALVSTPSLLWPPAWNLATFNSLINAALIDATGEKIAALGNVWWPEKAAGSGTKNISKVHLRFGTVVKAGGSALTLSLQDVDLTNGPIMRPDGTQDQTCAIANANASFASNTWIACTLSGTRTVSLGERMAVVLEFDGSGRLGSDSVYWSVAVPALATGETGTLNYTTSWGLAGGTRFAAMILEFDDGTFGNIYQLPPCTVLGVSQYNSGTTPDEWASKITMPFTGVVEGVMMQMNPNAATSTIDIELLDTDGSTVLTSKSPDPNDFTANNSYGWNSFIFSSPVQLTAGNTYYLTVRPTFTSNVNLCRAEVAHVDHWQAFPWGDGYNSASRLNGAGAWTDQPLIRHDIHLMISAVDVGGAGGGLLVNPGMRGGMV
jgi:hypothetical protein